MRYTLGVNETGDGRRHLPGRRHEGRAGTTHPTTTGLDPLRGTMTTGRRGGGVGKLRSALGPRSRAMARDGAVRKPAGLIIRRPQVRILLPQSRSSSAAGWSSQVARRAHNPKVAGSNPVPAIKTESGGSSGARPEGRGPKAARPNPVPSGGWAPALAECGPLDGQTRRGVDWRWFPARVHAPLTRVRLPAPLSGLPGDRSFLRARCVPPGRGAAGGPGPRSRSCRAPREWTPPPGLEPGPSA